MMSGRTNQEKVLHFHHVVRHALRKPDAAAIPEEDGGGQAKLHPGEVQSNADAGACTKGREELLLLS